MNIGCQVSEKCANRLASVRLAREPEMPGNADWLDRAATQFRLAMTLQIPVGFEDEAGFHCGVPGRGENAFVLQGRKMSLRTRTHFDPGAQPFLQWTSPAPPPWRLWPGSDFLKILV